MKMELTSEQKNQVADWVGQGLGLSEIQKKITAEMRIIMTYMDVRFLVDDLKLKLKDKEAKRDAASLAIPAAGAGTPVAREYPEEDAADNDLHDQAPTGASGVSVEVDRITKPGSVVSGSVRFSDGTKATWMLDNYGRLGLSADQKNYRPSQEDLKAFQEELSLELQKRGF